MSRTVERQDVIALLNRGDLTAADIASHTGLSRARIYQLAQRQQLYEHWLKIAADEARKPVLDREIWYLPLSYRVRRGLTSVGTKNSRWRHTTPPPTPTIVHVRDLLEWTAADILKLYDFGRKSFRELEEFLIKENLQFKPLPPSPSIIWTSEYIGCPHCHGTGQKLVKRSFIVEPAESDENDKANKSNQT